MGTGGYATNRSMVRLFVLASPCSLSVVFLFGPRNYLTFSLDFRMSPEMISLLLHHTARPHSRLLPAAHSFLCPFCTLATRTFSVTPNAIAMRHLMRETWDVKRQISANVERAREKVIVDELEKLRGQWVTMVDCGSNKKRKRVCSGWRWRGVRDGTIRV